MNLCESLESRIFYKEPIKKLFEKSIELPADSLDRIRVILEDILFDMTATFVSRQFVGYYRVHRATRVIEGLYPVNLIELAFLMFCMSVLTFDYVDEDQAMKWVSDMGVYVRLIDEGEWRIACDTVYEAIRSAMAAKDYT